MSDTRPTNHLRHETSLYLRQHVHNPVDWYPWGPEALERARREDKPIFLSIGYSACHWCHVMEHESFEKESTARILNEHFISIKVDREERPDLDQIYMNAVMMMTQGRGGWPLSVFLTPDLRPFYGGTYFPPEDRYGMPGFESLLEGVHKAWQERREQVLQAAGQYTEHLRLAQERDGGAVELDARPIQRAVQVLERICDRTHGGFGRAPKFPHAMELKLLLRHWQREGDADSLDMACLTLDRMAMGGMYDHLGGGFHRYSTDARWLVPHFEKMLYDNALLGQAYLEAYQATGKRFYRDVVEETLDWVQAEMTAPEGGFYSTLDADSEGVEGKFYVWSLAEIEAVLGQEPAEWFSRIYDVSKEGNWEEHNILNRAKSDAQEAKLLGMSEEELRKRLAESKRQLLAVRARRVRPGRDEKVLTSWNSLMIAAFAQAAQVLDPRFLAPAVRAAEFVSRTLRGPDGRLFRTYSSGSAPRLNAYLEDYAFLLDALVSLYEAGFEERWIALALELAEVLVDQFWDEAEGGFFYTGKDHEALIVRTKDPQDGSIPSGNSMAATALLRLARLTGRQELESLAVRTLQTFAPLMAESPMAAGQMLIALDYHLGPVTEFAVIGPRSAAATREALQLIQGGFRPRKVVVHLDPAHTDPERDRQREELLPLLRGKVAQRGQVTTYLCENFACRAPLVGAEDLRRALEAGETTA
jgi:uncharacterized protein YyaL (SSP411 family)